MKWKMILKIVIGIFSLLLIVDVVASFYFYNLAISRGPKKFLNGNPDLTVSAEAMDVFLDGDWRDWVANQTFEEVELTSYDGLNLKGYFLPAKEPSHKLVVLAHGYLGHAKDMGLYAQYYFEEMGYNVFTADLRGHGNSEGDYIGFGWHDRLDYVEWIDLMIEKLGPDTEIVLHGLSMGATTVLMTSGEDLPGNVRAVIADSPYTSVHDMFAYQMKKMYNIPSFPILNSTSLVSQFKAGYSFKEASALPQVEKTRLPILYIHGNEDTFVPTDLTHELYDHTSSEKDLFIVDGASYGEGFVLEKEAYINHMENFLTKYMK